MYLPLIYLTEVYQYVYCLYSREYIRKTMSFNLDLVKTSWRTWSLIKVF